MKYKKYAHRASFFENQKNVTYERFSFMSRKQEIIESTTDYVVALRSIATHCVYGQLTDSLIRDAIIVHCKLILKLIIICNT